MKVSDIHKPRLDHFIRFSRRDGTECAGQVVSRNGRITLLDSGETFNWDKGDRLNHCSSGNPESHREREAVRAEAVAYRQAAHVEEAAEALRVEHRAVLKAFRKESTRLRGSLRYTRIALCASWLMMVGVGVGAWLYAPVVAPLPVAVEVHAPRGAIIETTAPPPAPAVEPSPLPPAIEAPPVASPVERAPVVAEPPAPPIGVAAPPVEAPKAATPAKKKKPRAAKKKRAR